MQLRQKLVEKVNNVHADSGSPHVDSQENWYTLETLSETKHAKSRSGQQKPNDGYQQVRNSTVG